MSKRKAPLPELAKTSVLIDSHCHLDMAAYAADLQSVVERAHRHNVTGVVTIGTDLSSSRAAVGIAQKYPSIWATVGIHPHDAESATHMDLSHLSVLAQSNPQEVVGYGEIGLDYAKMYSKPEIQRSLFRNQLALARELNLPIIIHNRDAHEDCLEIITEEGPLLHGGVMHCFSGDLEFAKKVIDLNLHVSIPGIVTYKKAHDLQRVAAQTPLERLLIESDGPFLAPVPYRGRRNEPVYTLYTAAFVASLRKTSIEVIADQTTKNVRALFKLSDCCSNSATKNGIRK